MKREYKTYAAAAAAGILGLLTALIGNVADLDWWGILNSPFTLLGEGLRALSLSGFVGNLAAWAVTLAVCALPLLLLRRGGGLERALPVLAVPVLFFTVFFVVNPTWLDTPLRAMFPFAGVCTALSLLLGWWVLRTLRRMEAAENETAARALELLLTVCALLLAFHAVYGAVSQVPALLAADMNWQTALVQAVILGLKAGLDLLTAWIMLLGADLAGHLDGMAFDQDAVELCGRIAKKCGWVVRRTVEATAAINLLQLVQFEVLQDTDFNVELPLFSLALSTGLFLLCRLLERGKALQEDSDSII